MPIPRSLREKLDKARTGASLKDLSTAFGGAKSIRSTVQAVRQLSLERGISTVESAKVLRGTRQEIVRGRKRLTDITTGGPVTVAVARRTLSTQGTTDVGRQRGIKVPSQRPFKTGIIDFVLKEAGRGQVIKRGRGVLGIPGR